MENNFTEGPFIAVGLTIAAVTFALSYMRSMFEHVREILAAYRIYGRTSMILPGQLLPAIKDIIPLHKYYKLAQENALSGNTKRSKSLINSALLCI